MSKFQLGLLTLSLLFLVCVALGSFVKILNDNWINPQQIERPRTQQQCN